MYVTAGLRLLLGPEDTIVRRSAYAPRSQKQLRAVGTIDATMRTCEIDGDSSTNSQGRGPSRIPGYFEVQRKGLHVNVVWSQSNRFSLGRTIFIFWKSSLSQFDNPLGWHPYWCPIKKSSLGSMPDCTAMIVSVSTSVGLRIVNFRLPIASRCMRFVRPLYMCFNPRSISTPPSPSQASRHEHSTSRAPTRFHRAECASAPPARPSPCLSLVPTFHAPCRANGGRWL